MIDARSFAQSPVISRADFFSALERNLNEFISSQTKWGGRILNALKSIKGVEVSAGPPTSVSLSWGTPRDDTADLAGLFASLGKVAESKDKDTRFIIAFDEAQEFRRLAGYDLAKLLAHIYDFIPWAFLVRSRLRDSYLPDRYFFAKVGDFDFTSRVFMPEAVLLLQLSRGGALGGLRQRRPNIRAMEVSGPGGTPRLMGSILIWPESLWTGFAPEGHNPYSMKANLASEP